MEAQAAAEQAQDALDEAEQQGLSSQALDALRAERDRTRAYADRGVFDEINAETVGRRKREAEGTDPKARERSEAQDSYYKRQEPRKYRRAYAAIEGDCLTIGSEPFRGAVKEQPPKWFRRLMPRRSRQKRRKGRGGHSRRSSKRRGSKSSRGSPDDPDPEPPRGLDGLIDCGIPMCIVVVPSDCGVSDG